jgi:hypothetical protein
VTSTAPDSSDLPPVPRSTPAVDPWDYRPDAGWSTERDLVGYRVKATDGSFGKVDLASHAHNESYLVVSTGPWVFGPKVVVPAGLISSIDHSERNVYLVCSRDVVKSAPDYPINGGTPADPASRDKLTEYYRAELTR